MEEITLKAVNAILFYSRNVFILISGQEAAAGGR